MPQYRIWLRSDDHTNIVTIADLAVERMADELGAASGRQHPGPVGEGRIVAHMLAVPAFEHGHPVMHFILAIIDDLAEHIPKTIERGLSGLTESTRILSENP